MKTIHNLMFLMTVFICVGSQASERIVRFGDLSGDEVKQVLRGGSSTVTIEFRQGDKLPVRLTVEGDLLEGQEDSAVSLTVKRTFYVKVKHNDLYVSIDGTKFKPLKKAVKGSFGVGVSGEPANEIQAILRAELR